MREVVIRPRDAISEELQASLSTESQDEIRVPSVLETPHPLVAQSVLAIRRSKPNANGVLQPKPGTCLDVRVSSGSADRAMCILDALLKALDVRASPVSIRGEEQPVTIAHIGDDDVPFHIEERIARVERKPSRYNWPEYEWVGTGELTIRIDHYWADGRRQSWADGKKQRVEMCVNAFVAGLFAISE